MELKVDTLHATNAEDAVGDTHALKISNDELYGGYPRPPETQLGINSVAGELQPTCCDTAVLPRAAVAGKQQPSGTTTKSSYS